MSITTDESDNARIWDTSSSSTRKSFSRFRPSCFRDAYSAVPIVISILALFLVIGTIFGVAVRWNQMQAEIAELKSNQQTQPATSKQVDVPPPPFQPFVSYVRWGRKTCSSSSDLVYSGFGAGSSSGSQNLKGGGVEYLCLPFDPEWNKYDMKNDSYAYSWIYAAEYLSYEELNIFPAKTHGHNMACSVCLAPRSTQIMIPGKRSCPLGWTSEYEGYLMTSYVTTNKMSIVCVDKEPDYIGGTQNVTGGAQLFFVSPFCNEQFGGISHCPPYVNARELTCVVCSK
ncbi:uncharacterized protein [Watersipora subatra]|uniref:uncharacterized protein n=1 Tax=Watersipora subatra TaxID=2589382 RepID=UPI00355C6E72